MSEIAASSVLMRLAEKGWRPTLDPFQLMKMYDGYVGMLQLDPAAGQRPQRVMWTVWLTGPLPLRSGSVSTILRAASKADTAVTLLSRAA
jgi:hypothetical protein